MGVNEAKKTLVKIAGVARGRAINKSRVEIKLNEVYKFLLL
jgi:hypothetical protein